MEGPRPGYTLVSLFVHETTLELESRGLVDPVIC
jgi:hypothetical protein